jgi:hypothetical protein
MPCAEEQWVRLLPLLWNETRRTSCVMDRPFAQEQTPASTLGVPPISFALQQILSDILGWVQSLCFK